MGGAADTLVGVCPIVLQGEYIAPEKIENIYGRSMFVAQTFLYGNSFKVCEVAILLHLVVGSHMVSSHPAPALCAGSYCAR